MEREELKKLEETCSLDEGGAVLVSHASELNLVLSPPPKRH